MSVHYEGGVIFPIVFRQLQPRVGFGWATRAIGFIAIGTSVIFLLGIKQRVPPHGQRRLIDTAALKSLPFLYYSLGAFFGFMGIYVAFFYIQLYAAQQISMSPNVALNLLAIVNAGSVFGRLIPSFFADKIGPLNMQIPFAVIASILAFSWIRISETAGLVVFCVLYGFFSGTFVSLQGPTVASLCPELGSLGTWLGMGLGFSGFGLLAGNPVAGAILHGPGGWEGLQVWCGGIVLASALCMLLARISKAGWGIRTVV